MSDPWAEFRDKAAERISMGEDVMRSGVSGVVEGGAALLGTPGDIVGLIKSAPVAAAGALEKRGIAPKGSADFLTQALQSGPPGISGGAPGGGTYLKALASAAANRGGADPKRTAAVLNAVPTSPTDLPGKTEIEAALGSPKYHKPQTTAGEYARTIGQFAPAAVFPGSAPARLANVLAPALTSETAGQITEGSPIEPYARVAGALLGAGGAALARQPRPTTRMLAEGSRGASDEQIMLARALREDAASRGITLTQAEAVQQVTGGGTGLGRLQRVLEGTRAGSERIAPVMSQRPAQVAGAVGQFADNLAPPSPNPGMVGAQAQEAAEQSLTGVRQAVNANARPWYDALKTERLPPTPQAAQLSQNPAYQEALATVRGNPVLNAEIANLPDDSLAVVNEVVKHLDTLAENARPNPAASTGNAQMSAAYHAASRSADELASAYSEPWRLARGMVSSGREAFLEPLQRGPLGAVSATPNVQAQTRAMFPSAPVEGAADETSAALQVLMDQNPSVPPDLLRQHLMNTFNEAQQNLQSGPNQWGGAKFAATVAGNPEQARTLMAGTEAAGGNPGELQALLRALEATGKRQAPGSQTAYNMEDLKNLGSTGAAGEILQTGLNPPGTFRRIGDAFQRFQVERNAAQLAEALLASPERASEILLEARRTLPAGTALQEIERLALTGAQARPRELPYAPRP